MGQGLIVDIKIDYLAAISKVEMTTMELRKVLEPSADLFFGFFCILCKKWKGNIRPPCAVKSLFDIIGRDAPFFYSV